MSRQELLARMKDATNRLRDQEVKSLIQEAIDQGMSPMEIITDGLNPGLTIIGEGFAKAERFMSEMVLAGEIMNESMEILRPVMEAGGRSTGDTMIIGTVQGDLHTIGKRIVTALFTGAGYRVIDIGEDMPASEFVKAAKEHKAAIVGASATLSPVKPYCKVIHDAMVDAGIRDDLLYIIGGWNMTQTTSDALGADCCGETAIDGLDKVRAILKGEVPRWAQRTTG